MHIALLYSAEHSGHAQAAHALKEALQAKDPSLQISEIDLIRKIYPFLGPLVAKAYLEILKQTPLLWETLWNNPSVEEATQEVRDLFHSMDGLKLQGILNVLRPDALVCTHALPCATLAKAKQRGRLGIPLIGVLTDFWAHSYWPCAGVDLYLTPTEEVRLQFLARKIPDSKVQRTGIPLRSPFSQRIAKSLARTKLALDPERPTVLLSGGSRGLGPLETTVKVLEKHLPFLQILVATGLRTEIFSRLQKRYQPHPRIRCYPFQPQMHLLMSAADLLLGKPGGLTSSEALALGLPMLLLSPLPGQEKRNASYLIRHGAALEVEGGEDLPEILQKLLADLGTLEKMGQRAKALGTPDAAKIAAEAIGRLLQKHAETATAL